jgi:hypothetical protein
MDVCHIFIILQQIPNATGKASTAAARAMRRQPAAATAKASTAVVKTDALAGQTANHHEVRECACRA